MHGHCRELIRNTCAFILYTDRSKIMIGTLHLEEHVVMQPKTNEAKRGREASPHGDGPGGDHTDRSMIGCRQCAQLRKVPRHILVTVWTYTLTNRYALSAPCLPQLGRHAEPQKSGTAAKAAILPLSASLPEV